MQMVARKNLSLSSSGFDPLLHKNFHNRRVSRKMLKGNQIIVLTLEWVWRIFDKEMPKSRTTREMGRL
jgi:hypothetical protein